jgi:RPA family protein
MPVLIKDILLSSEESPDGEDGPRSYQITPTGACVFRAVISGVLMEKEDIGSDGSRLFKLRVADPTGGLSFTVGRFNPGLTEAVSGIEFPCFVTVVGKVTRFDSRSGHRVVTINPDSIVRVDKEEKDSWHLLAVRDALSRLWKLEGRGPLPGRSMEINTPLEPRGGEETVDAANSMIRDTLMALDKSRYTRELDLARDLKNSTSESGTDDLEQYEDEVVRMIIDLDSGDGARWDDLVDLVEKKRLSRDIIEEVISNLLDKGLLYEPVLGFLKAV